MLSVNVIAGSISLLINRKELRWKWWWPVCKIWIETYVQNYIKKEIYHGDPKVLI